jgi:hypothetical protein
MVTEEQVMQHCDELDRCNQRGGRMLTILDLLEARTLDLELAAWLLACLSKGVSLLVGARPGGAGKTTVMCSLINLLPAHYELLAADLETVQNSLRIPLSEPACFICHEISPAPYFAYLWRLELKDYLLLFKQGHLLVTNLHADDLDEARNQVCFENGIAPDLFNRFELVLFLRVSGFAQDKERHINQVYQSIGTTPHQLIWNQEIGFTHTGYQNSNDRYPACHAFLSKLLAGHERTTREIRRRVLQFYTEQGWADE